MKRRAFLTASGTIGIVGAMSGTSVVSSVFSGISEHVSLEEFNPATRSILDKFMADTATNIQELGLDAKIAKQLVTPVRIISKKASGNDVKIVYKNKAKDCVTLSITKGVERIHIAKS